MNNRWCLTWLTLEPAWLRLASIVLAALLLIASVEFGWLRPAGQQQRRQEQQRVQLIRQYRIQLQSLISLPALAVSTPRIERLQQQLQPASGQRFSLSALLRASGAKLERWHPLERGGQIALTLSWPQFSALLEYLATTQPAPAISGFRLQRQEAQLHLDMELAYEN